jgi:hypothetical protein
MIGAVTAVEKNTLSVACRAEAIHDHAKALSVSIAEGEKWSSTHIESNPILSASTACLNASIGSNRSKHGKNPNFVSIVLSPQITPEKTSTISVNGDTMHGMYYSFECISEPRIRVCLFVTVKV